MISEERLRAAAREAGAALDHAPLPEEGHEFSEKYRRAVRQMESRSRHPAWTAGLRRVAVVLLVLLGLGGGWLTVDAQAREAVWGWISETLPDQQLFRFNGTSEPTDVHYYLPEIPEGYTFWDSYSSSEGDHSVIYLDPDGYLFSFDYISGSDWVVSLATDGIAPEIVSVNGLRAEFYRDDDQGHHTLAWYDEEGQVLFLLSGRLDKETLIHYAESVQVEEK